MRLSEILVEMPLRSFDTSKYDPRHHGKVPSQRGYEQRLTKQFKGVPFPVDIHFADQYAGMGRKRNKNYDHPFYDEWGEMDDDQLKNLAKDHPHIKPSTDAITLVIGGPTFDPGNENEVPMTPWIVAHRLAHAILEAPGRSNVEGELVDEVAELLGVEYDRGRRIIDMLTMKSARKGHMNEGEEMVEAFAHYMMKGFVPLQKPHAKFPDKKLKAIQRAMGKVFAEQLERSVGKVYTTR